ncbi:hypothetical protein V5799_019773 [Amblyomma americanum]|uniref:Uncharacterized protein n=1 Tax=Amblyomma americanum TaxID=6943 RepID=A0AAQ4EW88_AMBAM
MDRPAPKVGDPCDGNEDCGAGKCCVRLDPNNGTVCQNLSSAGADCSATQLKEHSQTTTPLPPPSCRSDDNSQAEPKKNYTHPYDVHCPCEANLKCIFPKSRALAESATEDNVLIGKCGKETLQGQVDATSTR